MKVRYYADPPVEDWYRQALDRLASLHDEHGITVEIDRVTERYGPITGFPGPVRQQSARTVYERDLKHNRTLIETIDQHPSRAYNRSGTVEIAGNVAVVDDEGTVRWASTRPGYADGYGPGVRSQTAMDFLGDIASSPDSRLCIACYDLLDGDERFCPNCGRDLR